MGTAKFTSRLGRLDGPLSAVDGQVGRLIDAAMTAHHGHRLERRGHGDVLRQGLVPHEPPGAGEAAGHEAPWWVPGVPVREGNDIEVLVDGAEIVPRVAQLVRGAQSHVHLAAWHATPDFVMGPEGSPTLHDLLAETADRIPVRLLMWAGAPVPVFKPTRRQSLADLRQIAKGSRVDARLDRRERLMHCHHEKLVIVDDEVAVVGGLDLTWLEGNRFDHAVHDKSEHLGWHDAALVVRGPVVADVANHFQHRWAECGGQRLPDVTPGPQAGTVSCQMTRTVPEKVYDFLPDGEFSTMAAYLAALRHARHLVYLENQFLWSPEVVDVLIDKLQRPPAPDFRVVLVLPRKPTSGKDTTSGQLARLIGADDGRGHLLATTVLGPTADSKGVYVHAKVGIVDDHWLTVGSTNLNEHSLFNDTEVNLVIEDPELARSTRLRLWSEHLRLPVDQLDGEPHTVIDTIWTSQCDEQDVLSEQHREPRHRIRRLEGLSSHSDRLLGPLTGLVVDG